MRTRVWAWLLEQLQRRCQHDDAVVDVLEGDATRCGRMVGWCRACGAYRRQTILGPSASIMGGWTRPRPTWSFEGRRP